MAPIDGDSVDYAANAGSRRALFEALAAERQTFPEHLFGAPRLERFLQGNEGSLEAAAEHFRRMLQWRKDTDMATKRQDVEGKPWCPDAVPGLRSLLEKMAADVSGCTKDGHLMWVQCDGRARMDKLFDLPEEELNGILVRMCELREDHLDRLSEERGRLVKVVQVRDLAGFSVGRVLKDRAILARVKSIMTMVNTAFPENVHQLVFMNLPPGFNLLWSALQPLLNARVRKKFVFLAGDDFAEQLASIAGASALEALVRVRHPPSTRAGQAVELQLPAGTSDFWCQRLEAGDLAEWTFAVGPGGAGCSLMFHASFAVDAPARFERMEPLTVEGQAVRGSFKAKTAGLLWLTWRNSGSWTATRTVERLRLSVLTVSQQAAASKHLDDFETAQIQGRKPRARDCGCLGLASLWQGFDSWGAAEPHAWPECREHLGEHKADAVDLCEYAAQSSAVAEDAKKSDLSFSHILPVPHLLAAIVLTVVFSRQVLRILELTT